MYTIRPFDFSDADYATLTAIDNASYPRYPRAEAAFRHFDQTRDPSLFYLREFVERDGVVVAFGAYYQSRWAYHPRKFSFRIIVHPDHNAPDIRPLYYAHILEQLADRDLIALIGATMDDHPHDMAFYAEIGAVEVMREPNSELDVADFDAAQFADAHARVERAGITFRTFAQVQASDPNWLSALSTLEWEVGQDVPTPGEMRQHTQAEFEQEILGYGGFLPEGYIIALDGEQYVGLTRIVRDLVEPTKAYTDLTGVVRSHRRRGIARSLKARAMAYAQSAGIETIITNNAEQNPMYALNLALGFQPAPVWITFEKTLRPDA